MTSAHPVTTPQPLLRQDHDPINGYQEQENLSSKLHQASSSSTLPSFVFFKAVQDHGGICYRGSQHLQHALEDEKMSSNAPVGLTMIKKGQNCGDLKDCNVSGSQVKWMPSMRMLRKMMNDSDDRPSKSAHQLLLPEKDPIHNSGTPSAPQETVINGRCSNGNDTVRVCADCNTSRTPLWRSGPRGPKSLCNACGIRQRKARRRAMAAAAAASTDGTILPPVATPSAKFMAMKNKGNKRSRAKAGYRELETKKRFKINPANDNSLLAHHKGKKQLCLEDFAASLNLHRSAKFQRVFPQEEKEAAILLMALSCGSVRG